MIDIPKFGESPEVDPKNPLAPPKKRTRGPDPTLPTVKTGSGKTMALSKDLPLYRQPLLSVADKYKMCLEEIDRLRLEKAREQARSAQLMGGLARFAKESPAMQKIAVDVKEKADDAFLAVKMKDLVKVTLNNRGD